MVQVLSCHTIWQIKKRTAEAGPPSAGARYTKLSYGQDTGRPRMLNVFVDDFHYVEQSCSVEQVLSAVKGIPVLIVVKEIIIFFSPV